MNAEINFLRHIAYKLRYYSILETTKAGSGHATSCLSCAEIISVLFFKSMCFDPQQYNNPNNDRFILSKGHASAILYAVWHLLGLISENELFTYRKITSNLEGHPTRRFPFVECATGSLGIGLSVGVGESLYAKNKQKNFKTFVLMGDSEMSEGSVWESVMVANYYQLNNLIAIVDVNRLGQSTETMFGFDTHTYESIFKSFGWDAVSIDGHNIEELIKAIENAKKNINAPNVIIAHTIKGEGIASVEDKNGFHGKAFPQEKLEKVLEELKKSAGDSINPSSYHWQPSYPQKNISEQQTVESKRKIEIKKLFEPEKKYATRKAFGIALAQYGYMYENIISLDAEVKNSTFAEIFENAHRNRFFQCFVAEQNMVGMAIGFAARGEIPFVSTFGCFLTRAHDQLRMTAISELPLRVVGSHAGISIGEDGPSQMALEDIALFRTLPQSIIFYPCDAISTTKLIELMINYDKGISYLRTTREETDQIYDEHNNFEIGGCNIIKQSDHDKITIIGAGITLFQSLKAHELLKKEGISAQIIDLYCIKPINAKKLSEKIKNAGNKVIVVEDHYVQGGMGEAIISELSEFNFLIKSLAVRELPRSGKPEELRKHYKIDAEAIVEIAKEII